MSVGANEFGILEHREFPSLSGAPQQNQSQNQGQAVWTNSGQRGAQQTPVQRQPPTSQAPSRTAQTQSHFPQHSQSSHDDLFSSSSQFANRLDDFRNGSQGIGVQLGAGAQPQTGNIEEFPPLGRNSHADLGEERRGSLLQGSGFGNYGPSVGFSVQTPSAQSRNIMAQGLNGHESGKQISTNISLQKVD